MIRSTISIFLLTLISLVYSSHFRGGIISWRPFNSTPSGNSVQIQVRQRYSWRRGSAPCTDTTITTQGLIGDSSNAQSYSGSCSWSNINTRTACTDYNAGLDVSSGEIYYTRTIPLNSTCSIGYVSSAWFATLVVGANGNWNLLTRINTFLRPDGYINSSPVATTLPIIYKAINIQHVHVIQTSDFDGTDTLRCRWSTSSTSNYNQYNECGGVCSGVPGAVLYQNNCTIVFTLTVASFYAAVAIQIEDYYNSTITTPMSSVPLQFLFYGYVTPSGCSAPPVIIGNRPNRACIGIDVGQNVTEYVIAQVGCAGKNISSFITTTPVGMIKSAIQNPSTGIYQIILTWNPSSGQTGPQGFCAGAVDSTDVQSEQWCITFLVGFKSPDIIRPTTVQGSASPLGTIFQNHTIFSIQTNLKVDRPQRNGTYIHFKDATTNTIVQSYDCGWAPEVTYTGYTIVIRFPVAPWIPGHNYYVMFDSGVASGTEFCGPESAPITDPSFWFFNIWNPQLSSVSTSSTSAPTAGTITTRPALTSTPNTMMTTTGIVATSPPIIPTTPTTQTTITTVTTRTTLPPTTTAPPVSIFTTKDLEKACQQPLAIMTTVTMIFMMVLHSLGTFFAFTRFTNMFDPSKIEAVLRQKQRMKKSNRH